MSTPPEITSTLPTSGDLLGGTQVNVTGSGFSTASLVIFGLEPASEFAVESDTLIIAIAPPGDDAGAVPVTVITPNGDSVPSPTSEFTYISIVPPVISSVFPAFGPVAGGTQVTISGSAFSGTTGVNFGTIAATQFIANSDGSILVTSPAGTAAGIVAVTVTTPSGSSASNRAATFTYQAAPATSQPAKSSGGDGSGASPASSNTDDSKTSGDSSQKKGSSPAATDSSSDDSKSTAQPAKPAAPAATPDPAQPAKDPSAAPPATKPAANATSTNSGPTPGDYIPGGLAPVPDGKTGLGGTAGTGLGFGVGTLLPGGGGSTPPSNLSYYSDPGISQQLVQSLLTLVQNAASPDALEAQNIILRRMALEGDVIGSRIPPPRNISEIGGYLNLLTTLKEKTMREQTLAGILGVAGPAQPLGWVSNTMPLSMVAITNDRPPVNGQSSIPLTVLVRSDFVGPLQSALKTLHSYGATLPLTSPSVLTLPPGGTGTITPSAQNILYFLGRALAIAPNMALSIPGADPIALVGVSASGPFQLASNILYPPTASVPAALQAASSLTAVVASTTSQGTVQLTNSPYILIGPTLAIAGYYPGSPIAVPANSTSHSWAWLTNITGLVAGATQLGDELSLLFRPDQVASSVFASMLAWTWNGTTFAA